MHNGDTIEFVYQGRVLTATVETIFRTIRTHCSNCGVRGGLVAKEYVEKVNELQEDGGVLISVGTVSLKMVRAQATKQWNLRALCNNCYATKGFDC